MILPEHHTRLLEKEVTSYVTPVFHENHQAEIENRVQEAMQHRKPLIFIVGETDGEHTVEGRVVGFQMDTQSLQITNEWGRFHIPISNIVRLL